MSTCTGIIVLSAIVFALGAIQLRTTSATGNESTHCNEGGDDKNEEYPMIKNLSIAWIEKPPYTPSAANGSLDDESHVLFKEVLYRYIAIDCGISKNIYFNGELLKADNESHMTELLKQNKVQVAAPIFKPKNQQDDDFTFFKIINYPGSDFMKSEEEANKFSHVLDAVLKSWPLFAVTLILTAIAGIIIWALVNLTLCT